VPWRSCNQVCLLVCTQPANPPGVPGGSHLRHDGYLIGYTRVCLLLEEGNHMVCLDALGQRLQEHFPGEGAHEQVGQAALHAAQLLQQAHLYGGGGGRIHLQQGRLT
jgi:hypothetical protein